jgi:outer membrane immunogenic protein
MKKLLLSMAITAGFVGSSFAADLPAKAPRIMPAPVVHTSWTGCYIGAGGGYGMWNQDHQALSPTTLVATSASATAGGRGWFGTVEAGCDYQFADRWVVGVMGNYDFSNMRGDFNPVGTTFVGQEKLTSTWAVGGRVGYLVLPGLLTYFSGGYTQARFSQIDFLTGTFFTVPTTLAASAQTYDGWFLGSGFEHALDFLPGLFWKTEYRFATYQAQNVPVYLTALGTTTLVEYERSTKYVQTLRSELVWRFNFGGAPVVARY